MNGDVDVDVPLEGVRPPPPHAFDGRFWQTHPACRSGASSPEAMPSELVSGVTRRRQGRAKARNERRFDQDRRAHVENTATAANPASPQVAEYANWARGTGHTRNVNLGSSFEMIRLAFRELKNRVPAKSRMVCKHHVGPQGPIIGVRGKQLPESEKTTEGYNTAGPARNVKGDPEIEGRTDSQQDVNRDWLFLDWRLRLQAHSSDGSVDRRSEHSRWQPRF
jgi:hypothetical protein